MKVLIVSTSDLQGGAAIAAYRLLNALTKAGIDARMAVRDKQSANNLVVKIGSDRRNKLNFYRERSLDQSGHAFPPRNWQNYCLRQKNCMDHARHVAFHGHLPSCGKLQQLQKSVRIVSLPGFAFVTRLVAPRVSSKTGNLCQREDNVCCLQPLATVAGREKSAHKRTQRGVDSQSDRYRYLPPEGQNCSTQQTEFANR